MAECRENETCDAMTGHDPLLEHGALHTSTREVQETINALSGNRGGMTRLGGEERIPSSAADVPGTRPVLERVPAGLRYGATVTFCVLVNVFGVELSSLKLSVTTTTASFF